MLCRRVVLARLGADRLRDEQNAEGDGDTDSSDHADLLEEDEREGDRYVTTAG
jgi:hypothetical protein